MKVITIFEYSEKIGKKCELKSLSSQDAVILAKDYSFMIAVYQDKVYEMIVQLQRVGIEEYVVFAPTLL